MRGMFKKLTLGLLLVAFAACSQTSSNSDPIIRSFAANPGSGVSPFSTTFKWSIADPDLDTLTCRLDVDNDGKAEYTLPACTSSKTQEHTYTRPGTYTAKLIVEDGKGGKAENSEVGS